jgi:hypothetical protein
LGSGGAAQFRPNITMKIKPIKLVNAQEMARQYSESFQVPPRSALRKLSKGDVVKLSNGAERFWVQIESRKGDVFIGHVDNFLLAGGVSYNDRIEFHADNIYEVYGG